MAAVLMVLGLLTSPAPTASAEVPGGQITTWGSNDYDEASVPSSLTGKTVTAVAAGYMHNLALTSDGQVTAWGWDSAGQTDVPSSLAGKTVTAIAAGFGHSLALTSDGEVTAWGRDGRGESDVPASLADKTVTAIAAGFYHSLALTSEGQIVAWGENSDGQSDVPTSLTAKTVIAVAAGGLHSLALTSDGQVTAWGWDSAHGSSVPSSLDGKTVTAIAAGVYHDLALTSDGQITGWGTDGDGESTAPPSLEGKTVTALAAGLYHSLALTSDGQVTAWGYNSWGQATVPSSLAEQKVTAIAAGGYHSLAVSYVESAPVVGTAPISATVLVGAKASFTATATGTPEPTVQWQRTSPGGAFVDVPGAINTTYTTNPTTDDDDGSQFRAVFTNSVGSVTTNPVTLTVKVPPEAANQNLATPYEQALDLVLTGTDSGNNQLSFAVVDPPSHGRLSGISPNLTYTPDDGYTGQDSFTYTANDGTTTSKPATVIITVRTRSCVASSPTEEFTVDADQSKAGSIRSPKITTRKTGELLVAFVAVNGPATSKQTTTVTGGGLTWTLAARDNTTTGSSEIWQAYAAKKLSSVQVTATYAKTGYTATMTVAGFSNAGTTTGATAHASGTRSAPTVTITPKTTGSKVWAVGRVIGSRYDMKKPAGQTTVHDHTFKNPNVGYWIQAVTAATTAGKPVTIRSTSTTIHTWGYAAVEINGSCR